jgi:hypothetical protein
MDKNIEKVVKEVYQEISKGQVLLDWSWVKREAEAQLAGNSPNGSIGKAVNDSLKKAGLLPVAK